jgi:hypothetical protein
MSNSYSTLTNLSAVSNANSQATSTYTLIGQYDLTATPPDEVLLDVTLVPGSTPSSASKISALFATSSTDGSTWSDTPSATTEANSAYLDAISHPDSAARRAAAIPVAGAFGTALPRYIRIYTKNDTGVAYAASGHLLVATGVKFG